MFKLPKALSPNIQKVIILAVIRKRTYLLIENNFYKHLKRVKIRRIKKFLKPCKNFSNVTTTGKVIKA